MTDLDLALALAHRPNLRPILIRTFLNGLARHRREVL